MGGPGKDHTGKAEGLFNQVRTPAALMAGIAFGAAFGMPLAVGEPLRVAMLKRTYVALAIAALVLELNAVVSSSVALMELAHRGSSGTVYENPSALLLSEYACEWIACVFNFLAGLLLITCAICIRASVSIECPALSKTCVFICLAGLCSMLGSTNKHLPQLTGTHNILALFLLHAKLVLRSGSVLGIATCAFSLASLYNFARTAVHIWKISRIA